MVVSAVGDVPNTEWLAGTGLVSDGVIRVDARGLVRPDIAAVGDLAVVPDPVRDASDPALEHGDRAWKVAAAALIRGEAAAPLSRFQPYFWTEGFGLTLKAVGFLPLLGAPAYLDGSHGGASLMRWAHGDGRGAAVALNYRIAIPRLRRMSEASTPSVPRAA